MTSNKLDAENLKGPQKSAIFLLSMGEDYASQVFEKMNDKEIKEVAFEMSKIDYITPEALSIISHEFVKKFEGESNKVVEGNSFFRKVLANSLNDEDAKAILSDVENRKKNFPFTWSKGVNIATLTSYIESEQPQTVAMVLSHMPPDIASEILSAVPDNKKGDIALRIAKLGEISEDVVRDVDKALKNELSSIGGPGGGKAGGIEVLVDIINGVDKETEEKILGTIRQNNAEMADEIKNMMFVFEDLINIEDRVMRVIIKNIDSQLLTYSLKTATNEMRTKIFSNLSQRAGDMLKDDLETMGPVRLAQVEEAQQTIVNIAKSLEDDGIIMLGGKGKKNVLV
ncbi:MAG: flagellar motor switch protein FliG [Desulfobacteraceae bacterium 4572_130]|nr:MAG: flagellar motor switch protein FliG [Desulfobacteraceae bacterium 4572_130]